MFTRIISAVTGSTEIYVHEAEEDWLVSGIKKLSIEQIRKDISRDITRPVPASFDPATYTLTRAPTGILRDRDVIELGERSLVIYHTPGHSPGHIAVFDVHRGTCSQGIYCMMRRRYMLLSDDKSAGSRKLAGADRESRWCKAHLWFSQYTWTGSGMAGRGQRGGSRVAGERPCPIWNGHSPIQRIFGSILAPLSGYFFGNTSAMGRNEKPCTEGCRAFPLPSFISRLAEGRSS